MNKYRLKKEATQFFKEDLATAIKPLHDWFDHYKVDEKALEEVEPLYISYGKKTGENSHSLSGWDENNAHFHFTINFPHTKYYEYNKFNKGRTVRKLMDKIQSELNRFHEDFLQGNEED